MFYKYSKIIFVIMFGGLLLFSPGKSVAYYHVSGVVEFDYHDYETKIGNAKNSYVYWTQDYRAVLEGTVWHRRFMTFSTGVGYHVYIPNSGPDAKSLTYSINTAFFPGMKVSWTLFGNKSTQKTESAANIAGREIDTVSYGGTLNLHLNKAGYGRNNNNRGNNNRTNNYNNSRRSLPLPDISLSRFHSESRSPVGSPLDETRDDTRAVIGYRLNSTVDFSADGQMQTYKNLVTGERYDTTTANLLSNAKVSQDADLRLSGDIMDRKTHSMAYFDRREMNQTYSAALNFREKGSWSHYYRYDFYRYSLNDNWDNTSHRAEAQAAYRVSSELLINAGLNYSIAEYKRNDQFVPDRSVETKTAGLMGGATYHKIFSPAFLSPFFVADTSYAFNFGWSSVSSTDGSLEGGGLYYMNNARLGLRSSGWTYENLDLTYGFNNKRDHSPIANDIRQHAYNLSFGSRRIVRTSVRGSMAYTSQDSHIKDPINVVLVHPVGENNQQVRTYMYNLNIDHALLPNLSLSAGASRGQTTFSNEYTLSTLNPPNRFVTTSDLIFASALYTLQVTRNLMYRAELREEYLRSVLDTRSHVVNMDIDYRIRMIFIKVSYNFKEGIPDRAARTEQQYFYAKLIRPF